MSNENGSDPAAGVAFIAIAATALILWVAYELHLPPKVVVLIGACWTATTVAWVWICFGFLDTGGFAKWKVTWPFYLALLCLPMWPALDHWATSDHRSFMGIHFEGSALQQMNDVFWNALWFKIGVPFLLFVGGFWLVWKSSQDDNYW